MLCTHTVHADRVASLIYNEQRDVLVRACVCPFLLISDDGFWQISCGRDKRLNVYDLKKESSICSVSPLVPSNLLVVGSGCVLMSELCSDAQGIASNAWLAGMCLDVDSNRVFIGTYAQVATSFRASSAF
jgi:hypothetical protein